MCVRTFTALLIFAIFGQIGRMNACELEPLLVELALRGADAATTSFASILAAIAAKTGGDIEFDIRIDRDTQVQRLASVMFAQGRRVILALSADGQQILQVQLADAVDGGFFYPLANWFALPLKEKPYANIDAAATLLLGALRSKGLLPAPEDERHVRPTLAAVAIVDVPPEDFERQIKSKPYENGPVQTPVDPGRGSYALSNEMNTESNTAAGHERTDHPAGGDVVARTGR